MKKTFQVTLGSILLIIMSCTNDKSFDGKAAAKDYCNCMQENHADGKNYFNAKTICESKLNLKYHYFRIYYMIRRYPIKDTTFSESTLDSSTKFMNDFADYLHDNCKYQSPF